MNPKKIRARIANLQRQADELLAEGRDFTQADEARVNTLLSQIRGLQALLGTGPRTRAAAPPADDQDDDEDEDLDGDEDEDLDGDEDEDLDGDEDDQDPPRRSARPRAAQGRRGRADHPAIVRSRGRRTSPQTIHQHAQQERYSIARAAGDMLRYGRVRGIEAEVDQELARSRPGNGMFIAPFGDRERLNSRTFVRADQTTTTGAGAIPTLWRPQDFIDYLYPMLIGPKLGWDYIDGLQSTAKLPRQSGVPTVTSVGEQGSATGSNAGLDNVTLTPHTITANVNISRRFMYQNIVGSDRYVMRALSRQMAVKGEYQAIAGSGTGEDCTGLLNNTLVTQIQALTGNAPALADVIAMQRLVEEANAAFGKLGWLTSPSGKAKLRQIPKLGTTFPVFLMDDDGEVEGEALVSSTQVPKTLSYSGTNNLTALVYGNWEMLIFASFGDGVDMIVDPYTGSKAGDVCITSLWDIDTELAQPTAFAIAPNLAP